MKLKAIALSLAALMAMSSLPARADITSGGLLGAIAGGLLGSQVGQGNGRVAASALGAVLGFNAGQAQSYSPYYAQPAYAPPQPVYAPQPAYMAPPPAYYYRGDDDGYRYYRPYYRGDDD